MNCCFEAWRWALWLLSSCCLEGELFIFVLTHVATAPEKNTWFISCLTLNGTRMYNMCVWLKRAWNKWVSNGLNIFLQPEDPPPPNWPHLSSYLVRTFFSCDAVETTEANWIILFPKTSPDMTELVVHRKPIWTEWSWRSPAARGATGGLAGRKRRTGGFGMNHVSLCCVGVWWARPAYLWHWFRGIISTREFACLLYI